MGHSSKHYTAEGFDTAVREFILRHAPVTVRKVRQSFPSKHRGFLNLVVENMEEKKLIEVLGKGTKASPFTIHAKEKPPVQLVNPEDDAKAQLVNVSDDTELA
jgi:hypothetical protein